MKLSKAKQIVVNRSMRYINERRGWKTDRKIIVIESDDWGGIRMPNRRIYEELLKEGIKVNQSVYNKYDTLASVDDFEHLFEVLSKFRDKNGNYPIITANTIVANPDFDKIRDSGFEEYHYETFVETINRYPNSSFKMWEEGIRQKFFYPQLHGREHLNVNRWMYYLKNNKEVQFLFNKELFGVSGKLGDKTYPSFVQALEVDRFTSIVDTNIILKQGLSIFNKIFGYESKSFIAPNYIWANENEKLLSQEGVKFLQGGLIQKCSYERAKYHYIGEQNLYKQIYLTRNVIFEPSEFGSKDWLDICLKQIGRNFKLGNPVIICSHRVNFVGGIFENNRIDNLKLLEELLDKIMKKWPDVEFMSSDELGELILNDLLLNKNNVL